MLNSITLNTDYLAMKQINKLQIDETVYYRVLHHLADMITGVSIFQLETNKLEKEVYLTELAIEQVPEELRNALFSRDYLVDVTNFDKDLILEAFRTKLKVVKMIAEEQLNVGLKRKLLELIEVGGHYFGFVYEDGMPYTKFYHLMVDPVKKELYVNGVPPEMLPALFEAISPILLKKNNSLTIQVDNGKYARVSHMDKETALVTVVTAAETASSEKRLQVSMGFMLKEKGGKWYATVVPEQKRTRIEEEIKKSFEVIYQDLLLKVFEIKGMDVLKGI